MRIFSSIAFILVCVFSLSFSGFLDTVPDTPLQEEWIKLNGQMPPHYYGEPDSNAIALGWQLISEGQAIIDGEQTERISKYFVCTDCHSAKRDMADPAIQNPEDRLQYAIENNLPFLPGSSLYGMVNRTGWYANDYETKYGDLTIEASKSLKSAIQLCAQECSQGRKLQTKELDAILAYLWDNQWKLSDLFTDQEWTEYQSLNNKEKVPFLRQQYLPVLENHFVKPAYNKSYLAGQNGNAINGKEIYNRACLSCHSNKRVTHLALDTTKFSRNYLFKKTITNDHHSVYTAVRNGTYPIPGSKPYMPQYTKERMSEAQLEDLMTYLNTKR